MRLRGLIGRCCSAMLAAAALAFGIGQTGLPSAEVVAAQSKSCESLASLALPKSTITAAQSVAAGAFAPPGAGRGTRPTFSDLAAFCRVQAHVETVERFRHQD